MQCPLTMPPMWKYAKICKKYAIICKICQHDFYMQNMHSPLCWCWQAWAEWRIALSIHWMKDCAVKTFRMRFLKCKLTYLTCSSLNRILKAEKMRKQLRWLEKRPGSGPKSAFVLIFAMAGTFAAGSNLDEFRRTLRSAEFIELIRTSHPSLLAESEMA